MDWWRPTFIDKTANGHRCKWGGHSFLDGYIEIEAVKELCSEYNVDPNSLDDCDILDIEHAIADQIGIIWDNLLDTDEYYEFRDKYKQLRRDPKIIQRAKDACEARLDEVYEKTGINCFLNRGGFLIVPFAED